jgi:hypothetical protein
MPEAQPSLGGGSQGENCELCDQFVEAGETCNCDRIICGKCDAIVDATLGPCHGCGVDSGRGVLRRHAGHRRAHLPRVLHPRGRGGRGRRRPGGDGGEGHPLPVPAPPRALCLCAATMARRARKSACTRTACTSGSGPARKSPGTFFRVNHFNYVRKTASAGGGWVGVLNAAGEIEVVPEPADGNQ